MRRIITAADLELLSLTGQRSLTIDEDDTVTGVAREMAAKLGITIVSRPSKSSSPASPPPSRTSSRRAGDPWLPEEFRKPAPSSAPEVSKDIVLRNGTIVWPGQGTLQADISIGGGKILSIQRSNRSTAERGMDITGKCVLPGVFDPHVHLGIFNTMEADLKTETPAALWGGTTTLGCYRYEEGSYLSVLDDFYTAVERHSSVDLLFHLTLSSQQHLDEVHRYVEDYGIRSFKIYMSGVPGIIPDIDDGYMTRVYEKLLETGEPCTVCIHAENPSLVRWATEEIKARDGERTSVQEWSQTHPKIAEEEAIRRACFLTKDFSGISTYFVHISSKGGIEAVSTIKCSKDNLVAETTSPYLLFSIEKVKGNIPKWLPPLRDAESTEALWEQLKRGKVDTLGTDSVPMSSEIKGLDKTVWDAMPNAPLMEHHLPGILTEGVARRDISLSLLVDLMTRRPAEVFGIYPEKGSLFPGTDADLVVVDLEKWQKVEKRRLQSSSSFSLFEGQDLTGWPEVVIKGGKVVIRDGQWVGDPPSCRVLNRNSRLP